MSKDHVLPAKARLNFWVDWLTALVFAAMLGGGILLRWILPPGSRGGSGLIWLGQGRHFFGDIHFWLGVAMVGLVVVHVWLHWDWILRLWRRAIGGLRSPLTWLLVTLFLALMLAPLLIPRQHSAAYQAEHDRQEQSGAGRRGNGGGD